MKRILILITLLFAFGLAGELENLQKDIEFLSSESCSGRSLVKEGIFHAEEYIVSELEKTGIDVTLQKVKYGLNQILETPVCVIDGDTLRPGYDYIPHPFSSSVDKTFELGEFEVLDSAKLEEVKELHGLHSQSSARRYLIKKSRKKDRNSLLLFTGTYPMVSRQSHQYNRPAIQVNKELISEDINEVYMYNKAKWSKVSSNNIIAVIEGSEYPDKVIHFTAHYDHMGALGEVYYPGANDNASGVAVLMSLARYYADNPPPMTLVFCFFTGEEQGLKGSWKYVNKPAFPLKRSIMTINLDMVGSGLNGYGMVGGNDHPEEVSIFEDIREEYGLGELKLRHNAPNSDHFPFTAKGAPAMFFYASGGEQLYHHPDDIAETLDWEALENTIQMMKEFIKRKIKE